MHSKELSDKIAEINHNLMNRILTENIEDIGGSVITSFKEMGPNCFFDDMENEEQAKGAIKTLDWLFSLSRRGK